jgi:hypothetical protein
LPINSLWCWGGGESIEFSARPDDWYCDDPLLNRFAEALGLEPKGLDAIGRAVSGRDAVIIDLRLLEATKTGQAAALDRLLLDIERNIFDALADSGQASLRLRAGYEFDFRLRPAHRWRLWRARKNLSDWQTGF